MKTNVLTFLVAAIAFSIFAAPATSASAKQKFNFNVCMKRKMGNGVTPAAAAAGCQKLERERAMAN